MSLASDLACLFVVSQDSDLALLVLYLVLEDFNFGDSINLIDS